MVITVKIPSARQVTTISIDAMPEQEYDWFGLEHLMVR